MIGIAYQKIDNKSKISHSESQGVQYKMFMIAELSKNAEFQMIYQFHKFLRQITDEYLGKNHEIPPLYHWGHIEKSFLIGLCHRLKDNIGSDIDKDIQLIKTELKWFDLFECFKENPIVINGCFKFGLKEVANRLYELGLIKHTWKSNFANNLSGNTSMIMAYNAYKIASKNNIPIHQSKIINDIMEYNKVDCIVIHEIIDLLLIKTKIR
jgi:predicted RecB family nuclease